MGTAGRRILRLVACSLAVGGCASNSTPPTPSPSSAVPRRLDQAPDVEEVFAATWSADQLAVLWVGPGPAGGEPSVRQQLGVSWYSTSGEWLAGWALRNDAFPEVGALAQVGTDLVALVSGGAVNASTWFNPDTTDPPSWRALPEESWSLVWRSVWPVAGGSTAVGLLRPGSWGPDRTAGFHRVEVPGLVGTLVRPAGHEIALLWNPTSAPWPIGPPAIAARGDGFLVAWAAWGGDQGTRIVAASWGPDGEVGEPHDVWRATAIHRTVGLSPEDDGFLAMWIDFESGEVRGRKLDDAGAPVATAVGLGWSLDFDSPVFRGIATDGALKAFQVDNDAEDRGQAVTCLRSDGSRLIADPDRPPADRQILLASSGPILAVVEWPADGLTPEPLEVRPLRCSGTSGAPPTRPEPTPSGPQRADLAGDLRGRPRLTWNGSRFVVVATDPLDELAVMSVEPDGTRAAEWLGIGGRTSLEPSIAVGPDGRSIVAWTDSSDNSVRFVALAADGRPSGTPTLVGSDADGPPAAAWTAQGACLAWQSGGATCRPLVARLAADLDSASVEAAGDASHRCEVYQWPAMLAADADRTWLLWAHDSDSDDSHTVVRLQEIGDTDLLDEVVADGEGLPAIIRAFGPAPVESYGVWTVPVWGWRASPYGGDLGGGQWILVNPSAGSARFSSPLSGEMLPFDDDTVPASWSLVDDEAGRWVVAASRVPSAVPDATGVLVMRRDAWPSPTPTSFVVGDAPILAGTQAVFGGDQLGILWMEPVLDLTGISSVVATLRLALMPRSSLPE